MPSNAGVILMVSFVTLGLAACGGGSSSDDTRTGAVRCVAKAPNGGSVFCMPGDHCMSQDSATCQTGGALCGDGPLGGSVFCEPGDTCLGQDVARCRGA